MKYPFTVDKDGTNTTFIISNAHTLSEKMPSRASVLKLESGDLRVHCTNKREAADVRYQLELANSESASTPAVKTVTTSQRQIMLAANAVGKNHGKAWICTGFNVDKHSLPPEWEGELICYVYLD
ncbi:hypothetical protein [Shewanella algae]|uniref:hypothetical protein n=1 Tax=Shewanella algae TaxID=38313 RepID=UPI0031F4BA75